MFKCKDISEYLIPELLFKKMYNEVGYCDTYDNIFHGMTDHTDMFRFFLMQQRAPTVQIRNFLCTISYSTYKITPRLQLTGFVASLFTRSANVQSRATYCCFFFSCVLHSDTAGSCRFLSVCFVVSYQLYSMT